MKIVEALESVSCKKQARKEDYLTAKASEVALT